MEKVLAICTATLSYRIKIGNERPHGASAYFAARSHCAWPVIGAGGDDEQPLTGIGSTGEETCLV
jgi:hypothetical protein